MCVSKDIKDTYRRESIENSRILLKKLAQCSSGRMGFFLLSLILNGNGNLSIATTSTKKLRFCQLNQNIDGEMNWHALEFLLSHFFLFEFIANSAKSAAGTDDGGCCFMTSIEKWLRLRQTTKSFSFRSSYNNNPLSTDSRGLLVKNFHMSQSVFNS